MEYSDLVRNRRDVVIYGVPVTLRLHSVAFRHYSQLLAMEGRTIEREDFADGKSQTIVKDAGTMAGYQKIIRATILDGVVAWGLKTKEGESVPITEAVLIALDDKFPEFIRELFDQLEDFNTPLDASKKKT